MILRYDTRHESHFNEKGTGGKMKEVICPYCCERFYPDAVDFRLERPVEGMGEEQVREAPAAAAFPGKKPLFPGSVPGNKTAGMIQDEKLYRYYRDYLKYSEADAAASARQLPFVSMNPMDPEIGYSREDFERHRYVTAIEYKGQKLSKRLCPFCHNPLIPNAGKYDMLMFSMIGDTNVGKSVFLTVLERVLREDKFHGNLSFMGSEEERETYLDNLDKLLNKKEALTATQRQKVPPMPFLYTYLTPDSPEKKYKLIIFCDIAGEDCRSDSTMKLNGYHLKASDGFLFLIDVTRFPNVTHAIEEDSGIENYFQREIFTAINRFMIADTFENTSKIPAAVVLTKCDVLKQISAVYENEKYRSLLRDTRGEEIHPGYFSRAELLRLADTVPELMEALGERELCSAVADNFENYAYFVASALGKSPEYVRTEENGGVREEKKIKGQIEPYRVAEAFYWLLAQAGCIPYRYTEVLRNRKNEEKKVEFYYYENERASLRSKVEAVRKSVGVSKLNSWLNGNWSVTGQTDL